MKSFQIIIFFASLLGISIAIGDGVLELGLSKRNVPKRVSDIPREALIRRQESRSEPTVIEETVFGIYTWFYGGGYFFNISVGTPPQVLTVCAGTGESDVWLTAHNASACQSSGINGCAGGTFDSDSSSTYNLTLADGFNISLGGNTYVAGELATDVVHISDIMIKDLPIAVASTIQDFTPAYSFMGLGYSIDEDGNVFYPNIVEALHDAGAIHSRLFSLYLNTVGEATGTIMFGGIDTTKYTGELVTLDLLPTPYFFGNGTNATFLYEFVVAVTGLQVKSSNGSITTLLQDGDPTGKDTSNSMPVLFDTWDSGWQVPSNIYNTVAGLIPNLTASTGDVPCSVRDSNITLTVRFGDVIDIDVSMSDLIVPTYNGTTGEQNIYASGEPACAFMLYPGNASSDTTFSLGDGVMRAMYTVFDLDNGQVSIAQAAIIDSASNSDSVADAIQAGLNGVLNAAGGSNVHTAPSNTARISEIGITPTLSWEVVSTTFGNVVNTAATPGEGKPSGTESATTGGGSKSTSSTATVRPVTATLGYLTEATSSSTASVTAQASGTSTSKAGAAGIGNASPNGWVLVGVEMVVAAVAGIGAIFVL